LQKQAAVALPYRDMVQIVPILLSPVALITAIMAFWRFGADAGWTDSFIVSDGLLSHWQVWLGLAIGIQWAAIQLNRRFGRSQSK
jgi:hypothetical protein